MGEQIPISCVVMRGGTSKGIFLRASDLPPEPAARDRMILALFGSPDPRQIDGLGGADILTSKVAIVGAATRPDADIDYTFGQVSITEPVVDYDINCGNLSAAVGLYAVEEGLVSATEPLTTIRVHNTNTGKVFVASVPTRGSEPVIEGGCAIDGVPGTGAEILLDFAGTAGAATGLLLPTGRVRDTLDVPILGGAVEVTIVDLANLCVFFRAGAVGMTGAEGPREVTSQMLDAMSAVKSAAAARLGIPADGLVPLPVAVAAPATYPTYLGTTVQAASVGLVARLAGGRPPMLHKTFPGTAAACTAVAACLPGSVPWQVARPQEGGRLTIGHPGGVMTVLAEVREEGGVIRVERAAYPRTARRLLEGRAFVRTARLQPAGEAALNRARVGSTPGVSEGR
ncbi:MAG TPA: PrpF domain-containing protein, partial [bacterium]|nr:PrpF domain-containing protein [bacterium]